MIDYSPNLKQKIIAYYEKYYQECGLDDYKERAIARLTEEARDFKTLMKLKNSFNFDFTGKKHLIVGAGTGGLAVVLKKNYNGEVFGVEPEEEELEIIKGKCQEAGLIFLNFKKEFAEKMSFKDNFFDFIYCITVLEHVQDVEQSIKEMLRVLKPGGFLYINTPNYSFPVEKHYKIFFPTFLPKSLGKVYLFLKGKPVKFIDSINFLTEKSINKILAQMTNIRWLRVYEADCLLGKNGIKGFFGQLLIRNFFVYPNQEIIIQKIR